jgi:hypothetical protein
MNLTRDRLHTIGWGMALTICFALMMALTVRVNAVKSEVRLADRQIEQLRRRRCCSTPSSRPAPASSSSPPSTMWTSVSGAQAGQYLENERQLAALGKPLARCARPDPRGQRRHAGEGGVRVMAALATGNDSALAGQFAPNQPTSRRPQTRRPQGRG